MYDLAVASVNYRGVSGLNGSKALVCDIPARDPGSQMNVKNRISPFISARRSGLLRCLQREDTRIVVSNPKFDKQLNCYELWVVESISSLSHRFLKLTCKDFAQQILGILMKHMWELSTSVDDNQEQEKISFVDRWKRWLTVRGEAWTLTWRFIYDIVL